MKKYILIAGVNGAGKSTLYRGLQRLHGMPRVNADEILRDFGDWRNTADIMTAGKIAVKQVAQYFDEGVTFNQETTLCGRSILKNIEKAKNRGYFVELHYIGVSSVEIAKQRVLKRMQQGGHGIPIADIEKRYAETFKNLKTILPLCNLAVLYDNTVEFRRFLIYRNGKTARVSRSVPKWYTEFEQSLNEELSNNHSNLLTSFSSKKGGL